MIIGLCYIYYTTISYITKATPFTKVYPGIYRFGVACFGVAFAEATSPATAVNGNGSGRFFGCSSWSVRSGCARILWLIDVNSG